MCNHIHSPGNWKSVFECQVSGNWVFFRRLYLYPINKIEAGDKEGAVGFKDLR